MAARRMYTFVEKDAALRLVREVGIAETSRRLGISAATLADWKACVRACAYSPIVGRSRRIDDVERALLLAQLVHEQELEMRFTARVYRHDQGLFGSFSQIEIEQRLARGSSLERHLVEWLDPTFEYVAERLAA